MSGRFFLDTNIFVYSFDANSPKKASQATKLIRKGIEMRGGIVSYQVVQEPPALDDELEANSIKLDRSAKA